MRASVRLAFAAAALAAASAASFALGQVASAGAEHGAAYLARGTATATRQATAGEERFCLANLGPNTGSCSRVPLFGTPYEDDPWGRWDCRTMGNRQCGDLLGDPLGFEVPCPGPIPF